MKILVKTIDKSGKLLMALSQSIFKLMKKVRNRIIFVGRLLLDFNFGAHTFHVHARSRLKRWSNLLETQGRKCKTLFFVNKVSSKVFFCIIKFPLSSSLPFWESDSVRFDTQSWKWILKWFYKVHFHIKLPTNLF